GTLTTTLFPYTTLFRSLESGGDPNARSGSNAVGVAQYLAGTARACGLRVNEAAARPYAHEMAAVQAKIAWLAAQAPDWGKPAPRSEEHTSELQSLRHLV